MSDSRSWIDDADHKRIKGIVRRSADVIAAARHDLEEPNAPADSQPLTDLPKRELSSRPATRQVSSAHRRARLRQLLRNPNHDNIAAPSHEAVRNLRAHPISTEQIEQRVGAANSLHGDRLRSPSAQARFQQEENEESRQQDGPLNRRSQRRNLETATPRGLPNNLSSLLRWTQHLDYLTNVVIGVLAAALAISLFVRAELSGSRPDALPLLANVRKSGDQHAIPMASDASLYPAQGFNILPGAFREPLPAFGEDVSGLLFLADPLPTAPGITVLPYTGLPQALPVFPEDIAQLIMIASSPGPDGRDYLIRTLAFEASGETELGKVAVAHVILNRKKSGRWGRKIADVVTSPWQFEPWMTRKNEIAKLSRTDPRYLEAAEIADAVLAGHIPDPTAGATHFLNPVIVRERRGGSLPSWADSDGQPIGRHVFYCPECDGTKPTRAAIVEAGEAKASKATPAAADQARPPRVGQTMVAETPADVGAAKAAPTPNGEKPEARSKPKPTTQRQHTQLPWLASTQARQRRIFIPHTFW